MQRRVPGKRIGRRRETPPAARALITQLPVRGTASLRACFRLDFITPPGLSSTQLFFLRYSLSGTTGREEVISMETAIPIS